ncbi:hypothetical protein DENSPDRAFT_64096 [Dentipellis sp. KUC8613]|nr:hypothetical protein DENSPDRAFT_64096 [Dentipellis sp. KUC8613]
MAISHNGRSIGQRSTSIGARSRSPSLEPALFGAISLASLHGFSDDSQSNGDVTNMLKQGLNEMEQNIRAHKQPRLSKERVFDVVTSILGATTVAGIEMLELAPVPGLASVGRLLLHIWEALEHVQFNRRDCEDLTAFCVDTVCIVRMKLSGTGNACPEELQGAIRILDDALREAFKVISDQRSHLFEHRDFGHCIERCRARLQESLSLLTAATSLDLMKTMKVQGSKISTYVPSQHPPLPRVIPVGFPRRAPDVGVDLAITVETSFTELRHGQPTGTVTCSCNALPSIEDRTDLVPLVALHANQPMERKRNCAREYADRVQHCFDSTLALALWTPTPVSIGAVGYYSEESGGFITLFNALRPADSPDGVAEKVQSLSAFGSTKQTCISHPRPSSCNIFRSHQRSISFNVRAGSAAAFLHTWRTTWHYFEDARTCETWLSSEIGNVIEFYGHQHNVTKRNLILGEC